MGSCFAITSTGDSCELSGSRSSVYLWPVSVDTITLLKWERSKPAGRARVDAIEAWRQAAGALKSVNSRYLLLQIFYERTDDSVHVSALGDATILVLLSRSVENGCPLSPPRGQSRPNRATITHTRLFIGFDTVLSSRKLCWMVDGKIRISAV
jgi:hypothetical protein